MIKKNSDKIDFKKITDKINLKEIADKIDLKNDENLSLLIEQIMSIISKIQIF